MTTICVCEVIMDENLFILRAYDNDMKLWYTKNSKTSLFDLFEHEKKGLCCNWLNQIFMVSEMQITLQNYFNRNTSIANDKLTTRPD
ncbi:ribosome biogenesis protein WDR12 homolog isoform X2 [Megalopta genalis]|uniref:ribosome biogenesis protein WDR12 homolog isoform X2 n=1 Tax=Megalopta genalis TaxID=115081 RepID=UPI003FD65394